MDYKAGSIITDEGLAIIRRRPTGYLPDTEIAGQTHMAYEVIDNAFDEGHIKGPDALTRITICDDKKRGTYQLLVSDNGRGFPLDGDDMHRSITRPHSSGKFVSGLSYEVSAGLFGMGLKVTAAMSHIFRAITKRGKEGTGSLLVKDAQHDSAITVDKTPVVDTGTYVFYEPDATVFLGVAEYATTGYVGILDRVKKYCFFHENGRTICGIHTSALPKATFTDDHIKAISTLETVFEKSTVVFDSASFDRMAWILHHFALTKPFTWELRLSYPKVSGDSLGFDVRYYYSKSQPGYARLGMVNSLPIDHGNSDHIKVANQVIVQQIASRIADANIRQYYLDSYKTPIYMAIEVKYKGAEFTGMTKHAFINVDFRDLYRERLTDKISTPEAQELVNQLFDLIYPDIEQKYIQSLTGNKMVKNQSRLFDLLRRPEKFADCSRHDGMSELFLVEGDSAGDVSFRDTETMAVYKLGGKPLNPIESADDLSTARYRLLKNDIYSDILTVIGLNPAKPDMNALRYKAIVIMTDADQAFKA